MDIDRRSFLQLPILLPIIAPSGMTPEFMAQNCLREPRCRYLDEYDQGKWGCLKLTPGRKIIDEEVAIFVKHGGEKFFPNAPNGDHCPGMLPPLDYLID